MDKSFAGRNILWCTTIGLLLGAALIQPYLWWFVFVGTILFLQWIHSEISPQQAFLGAWLIGIIKSATSLNWFFAAYPLDWLSLPPGIWQLGMIALYWIPAAIMLGSGLAFFSYLYIRYVRSHFLYYKFIYLSVGWVIAEAFGAIVFSMYTIGAGSTVQAHFSFGHSGYALAEHSVLLATAVLGGVYVLSLVVMALSTFIWYVSRHHVWWGIGLFSVLVLSSTIHILSNSTQQGVTIALLEMDWPKLSGSSSFEEVDEQKFKALEASIQAASNQYPDYVILPEDSRLTSYLGGVESTMNWLTVQFPKPTILIDSSRTLLAGTDTVLRAYIYNTGTSKLYEFDKQYLVPQGEYLPVVYRKLLSLLPLPDATFEALTETVYVPGESQVDQILPNHIPAILFCFESVTPVGAKTITHNRKSVPFISHIVSHAWFKRAPHTLWHQLDAMLRVQAVYSGVPILQSANASSMKVYHANGRIEIPVVTDSGKGWSLGLIKI